MVKPDRKNCEDNQLKTSKTKKQKESHGLTFPVGQNEENRAKDRRLSKNCLKTSCNQTNSCGLDSDIIQCKH